MAFALGEGLCCWIWSQGQENVVLSFSVMMEWPLQLGEDRKGVGGGA